LPAQGRISPFQATPAPDRASTAPVGSGAGEVALAAHLLTTGWVTAAVAAPRLPAGRLSIDPTRRNDAGTMVMDHPGP
jgi:hypothetical protein